MLDISAMVVNRNFFIKINLVVMHTKSTQGIKNIATPPIDRRIITPADSKISIYTYQSRKSEMFYAYDLQETGFFSYLRINKDYFDYGI